MYVCVRMHVRLAFDLLQTKAVVFTLSATTSRIRRNWVKLLEQAIQNNTQWVSSSAGRQCGKKNAQMNALKSDTKVLYGDGDVQWIHDV